jgi:hypothetical protein
MGIKRILREGALAAGLTGAALTTGCGGSAQSTKPCEETVATPQAAKPFSQEYLKENIATLNRVLGLSGDNAFTIDKDGNVKEAPVGFDKALGFSSASSSCPEIVHKHTAGAVSATYSPDSNRENDVLIASTQILGTTPPKEFAQKLDTRAHGIFVGLNYCNYVEKLDKQKNGASAGLGR